MGLILGLPGYFIVAGSSVGLLRAVLMIEERLLSKKVSVYFTRLDIWSFALMINLLINPLMIHQFGCQLSYCLSFALIYTGKLNQFRTSVVLDLVSLPIILFYLYEWHSLSVLANLLIIPFFGTFIFPLVLVAYGSSLITNRLTQVAELILNNFDKYLNSISELPGKIVFGKPSVLLIVIFIVVSLLLIEKFDWKKCVLIFVTLMCMYVQIHFPRSGEVTFFDVGQGDSFLLREPFNKSVTIIDTGGKPNFFASQGQKDVYLAPNTSIRYLKSIGISRIDNLCLSHQDADHVGDLPAYLQNFKINRIYIPSGMKENKSFMNKLKPDIEKVELIEVGNGNQIDTTSLKVVHPFQPGLGKNEDSMVIFADIAGLAWLFMGDLNREEELKIIEKYPNLKVDILKLGHHGSKTSSDPEFIKKIKPKIGIISAGRNNRYGHPNQETLMTMKKERVIVLNTQDSGMIKYQYQNNEKGYFITKWKGSLDVN